MREKVQIEALKMKQNALKIVACEKKELEISCHIFLVFFFPKCLDVWSRLASNRSDSSVLVFVVLRYTYVTHVCYCFWKKNTKGTEN